MSAAAQEVPGVGSTKETWALAIQYIVGRKRAEEALGLLAHVSNVLAESLDTDATVQAVANALVPYLGDYCCVEIVSPVGSLHEVGLATAPAIERATAAKIRGILHPQVELARSGVPKVIRECTPEIVRIPSGSAVPDDVEGRMHELRLRSSLTVPIAARGYVHGAIALVSANDGFGRGYGAGDAALLAQVALRVAGAVELARLHGRP
jgi:GAF domain-containing protein